MRSSVTRVGRVGEGGGVEPLALRMRSAVGILARNGVRIVASAAAHAIALVGRSSEVASRIPVRDALELPAADNLINGFVDIFSQKFSMAKGQLVDVIEHRVLGHVVGPVIEPQVFDVRSEE